MTLFDVIVIGSGPAGCSSAVVCAKNGLDVLLITDTTEQSALSYTTPEALESIHPGVSILLKKIGLEGAEISAFRALYAGIYTDNNYNPLGEDSEGIWQGMHIQRSAFDNQLLLQTRKAGVKIMGNEIAECLILENNRAIGIRTSASEIFAKYIIDASGKKGFGGKQLNFKRKFFSPPLLCWTGISKYNDEFRPDQNAAHFIPAEKGWTWLAPQPPDYCAWTRLSLAANKSPAPPDVLKKYPVVGKIKFANMRWRLFRPLCSEGILLCGDAAGIIDPAAGQGIFNALMSGMKAADTILACLKEPMVASFHLALYDDWFVQQFETKVQTLRGYYSQHNIHIFE
ncbi:MAG: NAD(P)/FAD-dependent oxidoreductase [Saprospiraceae bacterium]